MSQHPFGFNNRQYSLDSVYNERAAPRMSQFYYDARHHHPVIPVSGTGAPHYAQVGCQDTAFANFAARGLVKSTGCLWAGGAPGLIW
ncbi:unnamed protein product [Protopolystoma xenopodis]|uniref:Uncharacterized protein n=1 Tax=Protopolystoma xenopodis TaxID=117903 RepID=A0A3S5AZU5_9PLAT|nr:unnamed protein product [Protopolystoma xenopodis]